LLKPEMPCGQREDRPSPRTHRVIRVLTSRIVQQCMKCLRTSTRKTRRLDMVKGKKK
jgi:hypothetical protein